MPDFEKLKKLCQLIRYDILTATTAAGSGHATSSLSAVELMTTLFFATSNVAGGGFLHYDLENPNNPANDRVIFSKGHASPLLYSLYHAARAITYEELMTLRQINSALEGHPTPRFKYVDVATGSLGQGLSVGVGMALGTKFRIKNQELRIKREPKVFVLLGDSEMAEGQVWEAMEIASYYKLNNLIAIVDVNRLGQRGETMLGWDLGTYAKRAEAFGWEAILVENGHDLKKINAAFRKTTGVPSQGSQQPAEFFQPASPMLQRVEPAAGSSTGGKDEGQAPSQNKPKIIIAKTIKGKGVSFLENKNGWHGKAVPKEQLQKTLKELGEVDLNIRGKIMPPQSQNSNLNPFDKLRSSTPRKSLRLEEVDPEQGRRIKTQNPALPAGRQNLNLKTKKMLHVTSYMLHDNVATRQAYGDALIALGQINQRIVVLDAEVSNSTYAEKFAQKFTSRYFEMYIAEQNMVSTALGLSKEGFIPFISSFAAFLTRSFDQIRMAQYSTSNVKIVGSHAGVSIGSDGPSQMALEDLAMMRGILKSTVLYPSDGVSAFKLTQLMAQNYGLFYLRTTREKTPIIYSPSENFKIGGSKILRQSPSDVAVVFAAGITVHEALKAYEELKKEQISICIVDLYSIKPLDNKTVREQIMRCKNVLVVEDHYPYGGLGEAVASVILGRSETTTPESLLDSGRAFAESDSASLARMTKGFNFIHLSVNKIPRSGSPEELLHFEEIDSEAIVKNVKDLTSVHPQGGQHDV